MTNRAVLNEDFPMRTFTVLLITLNYVRYRSPTLKKKKKKPIQRTVIQNQEFLPNWGLTPPDSWETESIN